MRKGALIRVPFFPQPNDFTCVPACLMMLLRHNGMKIKFSEVTQGTRTFAPSGTDYLYYAALFLQSLEGLRPVLYYHDPDIFPAWYQAAPMQVVRRDLQRRRKKAIFSELAPYVRNGGIFVPRTCCTSELRDILRRGKPVLVIAEVGRIYPNKGSLIKKRVHALVLIGFNHNEVFYLDPGDTRRNQRKISWEKFECAYYLLGGQALFIK